MFIGILIGFLIAWSIVWWQGGSISNLHFIEKTRNYFSNLFGSKDKDHITIVTEDFTENKQNVSDPLLTIELQNDSAFYDSTNFDFTNPDAFDEFLAQYNGQLPDSALFDSIIKSQMNLDMHNSDNSSENIHVKKDKLLFAKTFTIPGIEAVNQDNIDKLDSLLSKDISALNNNKRDKLLVEFWKSPINYKGYKTGKNKLVLFGIDQFNLISFKMIDKTLFMKYLADYYQIDHTLEFKSLIPVSNSNILSQLNNQ